MAASAKKNYCYWNLDSGALMQLLLPSPHLLCCKLLDLLFFMLWFRCFSVSVSQGTVYRSIAIKKTKTKKHLYFLVPSWKSSICCAALISLMAFPACSQSQAGSTGAWDEEELLRLSTLASQLPFYSFQVYDYGFITSFQLWIKLRGCNWNAISSC